MLLSHKLVPWQGHSQQGAMGANAPTKLRGAQMISYLPMWSNCNKFSWYISEASCSQLSFFKVSVAPNKDPFPSQGPYRARWTSDQ